MKLNIFLDDYRQPQEAYSYTKNEVYLTEKWEVVKSYPQFVSKLAFKLSKGWDLGIISFDHDLTSNHYDISTQTGEINYKEECFENPNNRTGFHCAQYLIEYCNNNNLPLPEFLCHSMNPVGKENILNLLNNYELRTEGQGD